MSIQSIDTNQVSSDKKSSEDKELMLIESNIKRLLEQNKITSYTDSTDYEIAASALTFENITANLQENSFFQMEVSVGVHTSFVPPSNASGNTGSGRLSIIVAGDQSRKITAFYRNERGYYTRHVNKYNTVGTYAYDSGWQQISILGYVEELSAAAAANLNSLLSNLRISGSYYGTGAEMAEFADAPSSAGSEVTVRKLSYNGDVFQTQRENNPGCAMRVRQISSAGVVGEWHQVFVADSAFSTTGTVSLRATSEAQHFNPRASATFNLGGPSLVWNNVYAQNAVTVISDGRKKPIQEDLTAAEKECAKECAKLYLKYKLDSSVELKGADKARYHIGVIAQSVISAFEKQGLDWTAYGIVAHESWEGEDAVEYKPAVYSNDGEIISYEVEAVSEKKAGDIYMVRYEELNSFVIAGLLASFDDLEKRVSTLEDKG